MGSGKARLPDHCSFTLTTTIAAVVKIPPSPLLRLVMPPSPIHRTCTALLLLWCHLGAALRAPHTRSFFQSTSRQQVSHLALTQQHHSQCKSSSLDAHNRRVNMGPLRDSSSMRVSSSEKDGDRRNIITSLKSHVVNIIAKAAKAKSRLLLLPLLVLTFLLNPLSMRRVLAATSVSYWDLYGRVPHDDWLFNMWTLTSPNLLKKSIVEAVVEEMPDVLLNIKQRKRINEFVVVLGGFAYFAVGIAVVTVLYKGAIHSYRQKTLRDDALRGYKLPTSAVSKKAAKKGKQIENMDAGWVDMELPADDINSKDEDGEDGEEEEEEEEENIRDKKKRRR